MTTTDTLSQYTADTLRQIRADEVMRTIRLANALGVKNMSTAIDKYLVYHPRSLSREIFEKAAVNPGTTLEPAWAAPLATIQPLVDAFLELARPATLIGRLQASVVPFNISVPTQSAGATFRWVGQGAPTPVGNLQLASTTLPIAKAAGIIVVTRELLEANTPAAIALLRREMIRGMAQYLDSQLTDPAIAAVANLSPASITNGAPSIGSAGSSAANVATDIKALFAAFVAQHPETRALAILMSPSVAAAVAVALNLDTLGVNGGTLYGAQVLTSTQLGTRIVLLDPTYLLVGDDGGMDVEIAKDASVEMDTVATSPPTASTVLVSLWQLSLVGIKITRFINWKMAKPSAVLYMNVAYV